jgi:hypothetical protein
MEAKHTPGPWHVYKGVGLYVDSSTAGSVCKVAEKRSAQKEANAHLIAAAPELLAIAIGIESDCVLDQFGWANLHLSKGNVEQIRAAIRKAKGE